MLYLQVFAAGAVELAKKLADERSGGKLENGLHDPFDVLKGASFCIMKSAISWNFFAHVQWKIKMSDAHPRFLSSGEHKAPRDLQGNMGKAAADRW